MVNATLGVGNNVEQDVPEQDDNAQSPVLTDSEGNSGTFEQLMQASQAAMAKKSFPPSTKNYNTNYSLFGKPTVSRREGLSDTTSSEDYYPIKGIEKTSTEDPSTGTWNQYAPTAVFPYAALDKNEKSIQDSSKAMLDAAGDLYNSIPKGAPQFQKDINEHYLNTVNDFVKQGQDAGWGKETYANLKNGVGPIGQEFHKQIANYQALAANSNAVNDAVAQTLVDSADPNKWAAPAAVKAASAYKAGLSDMYKDGTTDRDLPALAQQLQSQASVSALIKSIEPSLQADGAYKDYVTKLRAASTNGHSVSVLTEERAISDKHAQRAAAYLYHQYPQLAEQIHPDDLIAQIKDNAKFQAKQEIINNAKEPESTQDKVNVPILLPGVPKAATIETQHKDGTITRQITGDAGNFYAVDDKEVGNQFIEEVPTRKVYPKNVTDAQGDIVHSAGNLMPEFDVNGNRNLDYKKQIITGYVEQGGKVYKAYSGDMTDNNNNYNKDKVIVPSREINNPAILSQIEKLRTAQAPTAPDINKARLK